MLHQIGAVTLTCTPQAQHICSSPFHAHSLDIEYYTLNLWMSVLLVLMQTCVMVAFSTVLLQSDISNSCHPHRSENQSNNLFIVVFGDGKKMVDEQLPILEVRLKECQPLCQFLIVDQI